MNSVSSRADRKSNGEQRRGRRIWRGEVGLLQQASPMLQSALLSDVSFGRGVVAPQVSRHWFWRPGERTARSGGLRFGM